MPIELYKQAKADSLKLELEKQEQGMEISFVVQEKKRMLHEAKLKDKVLE